MKPKKSFNVNATIRGAIRRAFARSPSVQEVMAASRREVPRYNKDGSRHKKNWVQRQCEVCQEWASTSKMSVDHIEPVVSTTEGFVDWNTFVARLWCDKSNLQRICDTCHHTKTQQERFDRAFKLESEQLQAIEYGKLSLEEQKKWAKKFTPKKLLKYPEEFVARIMDLKKRLKK